MLISDQSDAGQNLKTLKEFRNKAERQFIVAALQEYQGNVTQTAVKLDVGRTYLHKRITQLGITKKDYLA